LQIERFAATVIFLMQLEIQVLGAFRVVVNGSPIPPDAWKRERGAALVKLLALTPHHRLHRERVMDAFWPDLDRDAAGANLRKAVHFARKALGAHDVIELDEVVALTGELSIDAEQFATASKSARDPEECVRAADLYGGELLPDDRYADWLDEPRKQLHAQYVRTLRTGKLWDRIIAIDPTDEEAQCAVMQAALDAGNRGEVIRRFGELRERLRIDLGIGPRASTIALYERALASPEIAPVDAVDRVRAALAWGLVALHGGDFAKAESVAIETRKLALGAHLAREVGEASALLGMTAHMQGRWPALFRTEFIEWVERPEGATQIFDGHLCLAEFCLASADGHAKMAASARELLAVADRADSNPGRALANMILGETARLSGDLDEAERLISEARDLHARLGAAAGHTMALERLAQIAIARGTEARPLIATAREVAATSWLAPHFTLRLAALAVQTAPTDQALDLIAENDRQLGGSQVCQPCSMWYRTASAIALVEAGAIEDVGRRLDDAERIAGMWHGGPWQAALWEARGVLRKAQGHTARAAAAFSEAAARFAELGRPLDQARVLAR
jgi:DNA-binding SARP family transcriptional activator